MEEIEKMCFWEKCIFVKNGNFSRKTVKISLNLTKIWIFAISYHPFHGPYYFREIQHHWHSFSEIMTQKVQKSALLDPKFPNKSKKLPNISEPYLGNRRLFCNAVWGVETAMKNTFV